MSEPRTDPADRIALPLLTAAPQAERAPSGWNGLQPVLPLPDPDAPEPSAPQGAYTSDETATTPLPVGGAATGPVELLAPAGGPDAAQAALHFGADAIYLGLKKFSARAEAENFTLDEVDEITAYAHSLEPPRRVFVTINTLIRQDELGELVEAVAALAAIGVDALIIQDLGVYHLVRQYFPGLELHASTQLSVHNRAGAVALHRLGFHRVVLARELTFEEVRSITASAGIETEVFIHGALCYSYSGLCLFSAQTEGRSGNRGRCAYSCRDSFDVTGAPLTLRDGSPVKRDPQQGFPFSMKDLALPDHIPALRAAGVSCFKIEGRKKSPLYVGTTTNYYRRLIDGQLTEKERPALEADLQTVFSRPWTPLFLRSHQDKEVADRDTVGHRGTPIGQVETILSGPEPRLRFRTRRALERHDGLQIDLPQLGKPFGFAVERLAIVPPGGKGKRLETFQAPAGALVEVPLPREHPELPKGAPVYCSSSQAVKQRYRYPRPKPGAFRIRRPLAVALVLGLEELTAIGSVPPHLLGETAVEATRSVRGTFTEARDPAALHEAVAGAFGKLGSTALELESLDFRNPENRFVPVSVLNQLRRELVTALEQAIQERQLQRIATVQESVCPVPLAPNPKKPARPSFHWLLKVDRIGFLDALEEPDLIDLAEINIDIARDPLTVLHDKLQAWSSRLGRDRIRLALPALTRFWEEKSLLRKIETLRGEGWTKWEAANLSAWTYLGLDPTQPQHTGIDLATDWSVYVINRLAAQQLCRMGVSRCTLSPEDGLANLRSLLAEFADRAAVIVYQDTPLFLAESCAYANLIGGCPGKANCKFESMEMASAAGERVLALDYHCRTIVLNQEPFCLSPRLHELAKAGAQWLRADFIYRPYDPVVVRDRWRLLRAGRPVPGGQAANFDRGIL